MPARRSVRACELRSGLIHALVHKGQERPTGRLVTSDVKRTFVGMEAAKSLSGR